MNKILKLSSCLAVASLMFSACDNINEEDRFIPVERPTIERVVLVQEFTGQLCVNCPNGAATIHSLQEAYPGSVIAVCFHPQNTPFTAPALFGMDILTCPDATEYYTYYHPNGFPAAKVNGGDLIYNVDQWSSAVSAAFSTPAPADLDVTVEYDAATRKLTVNYEALFNLVTNGELNVVLWLVENKIEGAQLTSGNQLLYPYEHNHVLRKAINGVWGETIGTAFVPEDVVKGSASIILNDAWVAENCEVIAVLMRNDSKLVEQAAITEVVAAE